MHRAITGTNQPCVCKQENMEENEAEEEQTQEFRRDRSKGSDEERRLHGNSFNNFEKFTPYFDIKICLWNL